jgi:hypothetical protein
MGKILTIVIGGAVFLAAFVGAQVFFAAAKPMTPREVQAQIEREVARAKTTLPKDCGPNVTWFDVEAEWHTIVYKYKSHVPREVVVAKKKELEALMKNSTMLAAAKFLMPKDVKVKYEFYDDGGQFIYTLDID